MSMEMLDTSRWNAPSFTRTTFHSTRAQEFWQSHIRRAGNSVELAEMESIVHGLRECGTIHIPNMNGDRVYEKLARAGLYWKQLAQVGSSQGFSHRRHAPVTPGNPNFTWFTVMGSSQQVVDDWAMFYEASNHEAMGKLLGFPPCCRKFFVREWTQYCDPIWQAALNSQNAGEIIKNEATERPEYRIHVVGHPGSNVMLRYVGVRTWFHIPCALNCQPTIEKSKQWMDLLEEIDSKCAQSLRYLLSLPLAWDVCHGYVKVITPAFTVHAGSVEAAHRYIVEYEADPCELPDGEIPGAVNGLTWPMRPSDMNTAPLVAAGGLST